MKTTIKEHHHSPLIRSSRLLRKRCLYPLLLAFTAAQASTVGWYRMEGTAGEEISSVSNSLGSSGTATAVGAPFNYGSSVAGTHIYDPVSDTTVTNTSSMAFSGGTAAAYLQVADAVGGPLDVPDFTIEMFMKVDSVLNVYRYFLSHEDTGTSGDGWAMRSLPNSSTGNNKGSGLITNLSIGDNSGTIADLDDGAWHHMAFVVKTSDDGNNFARFYMDYEMVLETTSSNLDAYVADVDAPFRIFAEEYLGYTDEVRFSDSVLSPDDFLIAIPEPGTLTLFSAGIMAVILGVRRRSKLLLR
ncbi:PEP-CTERM sorting domain-containing protein [Kiritimatiellaeota bacterium B1221]|nr:PEP-CTERM sorting domain-containing protein [Kiritimatiellaeota bacterium B1221]